MILIYHVPSDLYSQNSDSLKCWSNIDRLRWCDFKCKIPENGENSYLTAITSYRLIAIPFRNEDLLNYDVKLFFKKFESWTRDTTDYLLSHEQLHFDIAELYARKLRKTIQGLLEVTQRPTENDFESVIKKIYAENKNFQREYDEATIHGLDQEAQKKWTEKICLELERLKAYTSTLSDCD
jgi:hypothetical protein